LGWIVTAWLLLNQITVGGVAQLALLTEAESVVDWPTAIVT
jgi:hypothetical protein